MHNCGVGVGVVECDLNPTCSRFYAISECDTHTQTHDDGIHRASIASRGKKMKNDADKIQYCTTAELCKNVLRPRPRISAIHGDAALVLDVVIYCGRQPDSAVLLFVVRTLWNGSPALRAGQQVSVAGHCHTETENATTNIIHCAVGALR